MRSGATRKDKKTIVSLALPDNIVQIIDELAKNENRCRSNFIETFIVRMVNKKEENDKTEE